MSLPRPSNGTKEASKRSLMPRSLSGNQTEDCGTIRHVCQHAATMHQRLAALACGTGEDPSTERGAKSSGDVEPRSCEASSGLQAKGAGPLVADYARAEDNGLNGKRRSNGTIDAVHCSGCRGCWAGSVYAYGWFPNSVVNKRERPAEADVCESNCGWCSPQPHEGKKGHTGPARPSTGIWI